MDKGEKLIINPFENQSYKRIPVAGRPRTPIFHTAKKAFLRFLAKRRIAQLTPPTERSIDPVGSVVAQRAAIVAKKIENYENSYINALVPGKRIEAIFAFIRIKDFSILTTVLDDKIMLFVNQICEIVHGVCEEFHAYPNRSDGDSFLMIWKLSGLPSDKVRQMHDMAAAACAKIIIAIKRSIELHDYSSHPPLMQKIPHFEVELSFGLHKGWAIEAAIGSSMKIDPSYIGPDVNFAEILQGLNGEYGTSVCVSHAVVEGNSEEMRRLFRRIDRRGGVNLYSFDLDRGAKLLTKYEIENLVLKQPTDRAVGQELSNSRETIARERRKGEKWASSMVSFLRNDKYFLCLRYMFEKDPLFVEKFKKGFLNYECGEWQIARETLQETRDMLHRRMSDNGNFESTVACKDGPSEALLRLMESFDFVAPRNWKGTR